jgi:hypothetical protein
MKIENLDYLTELVQLDLSHNRIVKIEGIEVRRASYYSIITRVLLVIMNHSD